MHRRIAKGCTPDFVLPGRRIAVFVDGCFWHNCPQHGRKTPFTGPNASLWTAKLIRNVERDRLADQVAAEYGWTPVRVWECEVRSDPTAVARRLLSQQPR